MGSIPVPRIQDNLKPVDENLEIYAPDLKNHPEIIKGPLQEPTDYTSELYEKVFCQVLAWIARLLK
ncbi:glycerol-3-phosphate O-acyltransferase 2 [Fusarium falciforme]|nr:glycerol-3-phosphate O-acyltransferase 2 [Fusarium falciforme]